MSKGRDDGEILPLSSSFVAENTFSDPEALNAAG
jgi:hypothetical protein